MTKSIDQFIAEMSGIIPSLQGTVSQGQLYRQYERYCEKRGVDAEPYKDVSLALATHVVGLQNWWGGTVHHLALTGISRFVSHELEVTCA